MEDKRWPWILVTAIAPVAWGSTYVVTRHLLPADAPLWGGVLRALPAGLLVLLLARRLPRGSWWWRSIVLGVLNVGGFFVLVYIAGQRLPSSLAATVMSTSAVSIMLFAWLLLRRRPRLAALVGAAVGLVGVGILLGFDPAGVDAWGVAASLGAMVSSSIGFVLTAKWGADVPALHMTAWQLLAGSIVLLPVAIVVEGAPPALTPSSLFGFAYVAVIGTAVAYVAWFTGLRRLPAETVGIVGLLNPVTGVVLGVALAGEAFGVAQVVGVALVLAGIAAGAIAPRRRGGAVATVTAVTTGTTAVV
ncbi:EamA family transporter [Microbacterium sp. 4R-513]|uniref:EamA family transporter n=1 Tax=Microbacterium sp. 4R-513 TaxID=2567934 RepID=UPI0013E1C4AD|nr:EamA family transporter [Microbacterium sp. 4R-513]QIG40037.1 EamA family transporter [Microbacterium sp. 4R-513]